MIVLYRLTEFIEIAVNGIYIRTPKTNDSFYFKEIELCNGLLLLNLFLSTRN